MKSTPSFRRSTSLVLGGSIAALLAASPARAAVVNWTGSGADANWSTLLNWNGSVPGSTSVTNNSDTAVFNAAIANTWGNTAANPVVIDSTTHNIGSVSFDGAAGNFFIGSTAGNALRLSSGGTIQILNTLTAPGATQTVNAALQIQDPNGTYTFANNSANGSGPGAGTLNFGGAITGGAAGATVLTLTGSNTNANTIGGAISNGSATTLALNKTGTGTWSLTGTNSFTGGTTLNAGTLSFSNGSLGTSGLVDFTGNATLRWNTGNTEDISSRLKIEDGVTATLDTSVTTFFTSALSLGTLQTGGLTKTGSGTLSLTAANPYTGATTVNRGVLAVSGTGAINASTAIVLNNNTTLGLSNGNSADGAINRLGDSAPLTMTGATLTYQNTSGSGLVYAETIGPVTLAGGQSVFNLISDMAGGGGNVQTLTLSGLTQAGTATIALTAATTAPNATTNIIKVTGASATPAGQIIGPWATTGTATNSLTDYAVYDASGRILPAGIAASTEDTWTTGSNVTLGGGATLTAPRTLNSLRYVVAASNTLALGANNLETSGILLGASALSARAA